MTITNSARIHITGIVQGVGFRPFVYGLALQKDLNGWVRNTSAGVDIEVDGQPAGLKQFIQALKDEIPPLARIDSFEFSDCPPTGFTSFKIVHSEPVPGAFIPISPDVSICDDCLRELFDPENHPIILANFHAYEKKLDIKIIQRLINYCYKGGTLIIGTHFGQYDRYLWPNKKSKLSLKKLRGIEISELKRGKVDVIVPDNKYKIPDLKIEDTWYVKADYKTLKSGTKVLLEIEVDGKKQPGLICRGFGKGKVYYFLFNPYYQKWWGINPVKINRTSLPVLHFLFNELGIDHDTKFGNKGFNLKNGRINVHQQPLHYFISKDAEKFGTYQDEYNADNERYSGGVITDNFISFRGSKLNERGWNIKSSKITSIYISINNNKLSYFTLDPVKLTIKKDKWQIKQKTEKYKIYYSILK